MCVSLSVLCVGGMCALSACVWELGVGVGVGGVSPTCPYLSST